MTVAKIQARPARILPNATQLVFPRVGAPTRIRAAWGLIGVASALATGVLALLSPGGISGGGTSLMETVGSWLLGPAPLETAGSTLIGPALSGTGLSGTSAALWNALALASAKFVLTATLGLASWHDRRTGIVPPMLTGPLLVVAAGAILARFLVWKDIAFLPYAAGIVLLWGLHGFGGGDAKLLLAFFGLWPDVRLLWITIAVHVAVAVPLLAWKYRRVSWRQVAGGVAARSLAGQFTPTAADLAHGERMTFAYALAALIYLWGVV